MNDILEYLPYTDRNLWETTRLLAFIDAKSHFKNIRKFNDICEFEWEKEPDEQTKPQEKDVEISNADIERLKQLSKKWQS